MKRVNKGKRVKYLQLGERYTNGRIAKAENYNIDDILSKIKLYIDFEIPDFPENVSWLDRFFHTKRYIQLLSAIHIEGYNEGFSDANKNMVIAFKDMIDKDEFGKKKG